MRIHRAANTCGKICVQRARARARTHARCVSPCLALGRRWYPFIIVRRRDSAWRKKGKKSRRLRSRIRIRVSRLRCLDANQESARDCGCACAHNRSILASWATEKAPRLTHVARRDNTARDANDALRSPHGVHTSRDATAPTVNHSITAVFN